MKINILLVVVLFFACFKMVDGYKKGMVKEIISLVSLIVLSAVVALLAKGFGSYQKGEIVQLVVAVILLVLLGLVHHLLGVVFFSAKLISKLPVIHFVNKLLGIVFGLLEVILFLWTADMLVMMLELGVIGDLIVSYTEESEILFWLYRHNYLAYGIQNLLANVDFSAFQKSF